MVSCELVIESVVEPWPQQASTPDEKKQGESVQSYVVSHVVYIFVPMVQIWRERSSLSPLDVVSFYHNLLAGPDEPVISPAVWG